MFCRSHVGIVIVATVLTSLAAASSETGWFGSEFSVVQRVYEDCQNKNDIVGCLKGKALSAINKAVDQVRNSAANKFERDPHLPRHRIIHRSRSLCLTEWPLSSTTRPTRMRRRSSRAASSTDWVAWTRRSSTAWTASSSRTCSSWT